MKTENKNNLFQCYGLSHIMLFNNAFEMYTLVHSENNGMSMALEK